MFDQTHVMAWTYGTKYKVHIGPRFESDNERQYTASAASMGRLFALPQLTADWPLTANFTLGSIFLHWVVENTSRDLERAEYASPYDCTECDQRDVHPIDHDCQTAGYHGPSAMTDEERDYHKVVEYEDGGTE